jgi:hypothetical protein
VSEDRCRNDRGTDERRVRLERTDVLVSLALAALALTVFARSAGFDFVSFDDPAVLLAHPNLYDESSLLASLRAIFVDYYPREEPLLIRDISWAIDARLFGFANPFGYHFGNIALNAANSVLLYWLLRRMLRDRVTAAGVAACFAVLPVHVEAVAWVMGRKDLLAAFFGLAALLAQSYELDSVSTARRRKLYLAGLGCLLLALFSKASAVVLFALLALHRVLYPYLEGGAAPRAPIAWWDPLRRAALASAPHFVASLAFFAWYRGVTQAYGVVQAGGPGPFDPEHLANVARFGPLVLGQYLAHIVWPAELSMYYRWPHVELPLTAAMLALSAAIALGLTAGLAALALRRRDLLFFALAPLVLLLPYTGLFYIGFWSADRYVYLAAAGPLVLAAVGMRALASRGPAMAAVAAILVGVFALGSAAFSWQHQSVWRDDASLWEYEAHRSQPSLLSIQALARSYMKQAESSDSATDRREWLRRTEAEIGRGFERHEALGRVPSRYGVPETLHLARLHYLRGRVAELAGAPVREQVEHYRRAFDLAPERLTAIYASRGLFEMAAGVTGRQQQRLVEHSFDYFVHYLDFSQTDPLQVAEGEALLERNYVGRFPYLASRIEETRRIYYP